MKTLPNDKTRLREIILWATEEFDHAGIGHTHGMPEAIDEAVYLCSHATGVPIDAEDEDYDIVPDGRQRELIQQYLDTRVDERKPASYITQHTRFAGLDFYVDERVLIPRSPFAELIGSRFSPWVDPQDVTTVLDLCTGSACIAIATAMAYPDAQVTATDLSSDALDVAKMNRQRHDLGDRLELVQSDIFAELADRRFDLILSNPPYVSAEEVASLDREFDHEPVMGLEAGKDGLSIVIPMLQQVREHLNDEGVIIIEVGYTWQVLQERFPTVPFMWLEFEHGGEGVFTMTAAELDQYQSVFDAA